MREYRVIKNRARIGKPWLLVQGYYVSNNAVMKGFEGRKWKTDLQISEHNTKAEADEALSTLNKKV